MATHFMTTVLVAQGYDSQLISLHRCTLITRLLVRLRSYALDQALAGGADPDCRPAYSLRAAALIAPRHRRRLARQLRATLRVAELPPPPRRAAVVPLRRREIADARDLLEELADLLEGSDPVDPRGVACVAVLLHDGASPLYHERSPRSLSGALEDALEFLPLEYAHI
jgi:hypothetical protein